MAELSRQVLVFAAASDPGEICRPLLASQQTPRGALQAIGMAAYISIVKRSDFEFEPDPTAVPSRAAAVRAQCVAFVKQRIIKLLKLDWRILHIPLAHGNRSRRAILKGTA